MRFIRRITYIYVTLAVFFFVLFQAKKNPDH